MDLSQVLQFSFSGLTLGSIYALMAVSLTVVYNASRVISFSQGEFFVFGALMMITLTSMGVSIPLALVLSVLMAAGLGALVERMLIRPILGSSVGTMVTMTIAISLALRGFALLVWGKNSFVSQPFSEGEPLRILGASLQIQVLWIIGATVVALLLIWLLFERTMVGLAMRACSDNSLGASLVGISVRKVSFFAWIFGSSLGALSGILVAPLYFVQYASGVMPMLSGFIAMAIGGMTSTVGAVVAGMALGFLEAYGIGFISSQFSDIIIFTVLIATLLIRSRFHAGTPSEKEGGM